MNIQLINGEFAPGDALDLITKMIHIKISYHEQKIQKNSNEEDIKRREAKIKALQRDLSAIRNQLISNKAPLHLSATINIAETEGITQKS